MRMKGSDLAEMTTFKGSPYLGVVNFKMSVINLRDICKSWANI